MKTRTAVLLAAVLLGAYWWMATSASRTIGTTGDEIAHLTAGYSYWKTDDYRLQPENGNLPQRWAALPLLDRGLAFPKLDQYSWRISDVWDMGFQWFYTQGNDLPGMLFAGRAMIALLGLATGVLVFAWARRLNGNTAAVLSVVLFAFSPTLLAHGALITSDMAATLMFLGAVTAFWAMAHRLSAATTLVFGLVLGLLCVAKFSAPLVAPMCALLYVFRVARGGDLEASWPLKGPVRGRLRAAVALGAATIAACALALAVIWASYGFRYAMYKQYETNRVRSLVGWDVLEDQGGPMVPTLRFVREHHLLPESYVYGFAHTYRFSRYRKSFLNGDYRSTGWVQFFPYTVAVKTPLALFGLLGLATVGAAGIGRRGQDWRRRLYDWSPLLVLFGVYWAFSLTSGLNIGHRHILPAYPVFFIMASGAAAWAGSRRGRAALVALLAVWFAAESLWIRPHYLQYFNEVVGPRDAYKHLVDSSLDWGQDLPQLKAWLDAHPTDKPLYVSYFGSGDLIYYGIHGTRVGDANFDLRPRTLAPARVSGGRWVISVTQFQQVYTEARGRWDVAKERAYRDMLNRVLELGKTGGKLPYRDALTLEAYQFARLCHVLHGMEPTAQPTYSFLVFDLDDATVNRALYEPVPVYR
jgi:Dolichyl-phosphate-mannose-protein mannosyltransferase